ncbi:PIR protein [Plasmodium vivax]|uniref:VIR protein n=1 Tax=Plasmodium vivax TaxID=5855 RepID=A0A565A6V4_PLAVI|nr:PIR protein [Plasmodium vivax]
MLKLLGSFFRNYNNYKTHLEVDPHTMYCQYFKYWLYRERTLEFRHGTHYRNYWDKCILCVWEKLEADNKRHKKLCEIDNKEFSYSYIQVKKRLNEICSIKEKKNIVEAIKNDRKKCLNFNKILNTYLRDILYYITDILSDTKDMQKHLEISEECSLKKVHNLFDELECQPEVCNTVLETKTCDIQESKIKEDCTLQEGYNIEELCKPLCKCKECETQKVLIKEPCPHESLDPSQITQRTTENLPKSPYVQIPVTVLSSVVGTIFFFLFLYKFTPFRSWFLNRIGSKKTLKHKMKQDMEREFLGAPFQPPYRNDQNSRPRVGYSQN